MQKKGRDSAETRRLAKPKFGERCARCPPAQSRFCHAHHKHLTTSHFHKTRTALRAHRTPQHARRTSSHAIYFPRLATAQSTMILVSRNLHGADTAEQAFLPRNTANALRAAEMGIRMCCVAGQRVPCHWQGAQKMAWCVPDTFRSYGANHEWKMRLWTG